jgi:peptidoglycan/LPS O-acetylase OafA/YrhL
MRLLLLVGTDHEQHLLILKQQGLPFATFFENFSYAYFPATFHRFYSHLWTVCLEEQFYIVAPILVLIFGQNMKRRILSAACAVIAVFTIWRVYMVTFVPYPMVWVNPVTRMDPFAIGVGVHRGECCSSEARGE